jgi:hypothetical protein
MEPCFLRLARFAKTDVSYLIGELIRLVSTTCSRADASRIEVLLAAGAIDDLF